MLGYLHLKCNGVYFHVMNKLRDKLEALFCRVQESSAAY